MPYRLGIDLGGTTAKIALVDAKNRVERQESVGTANRPDPKSLARTMAEVCRRFSIGKKIQSLGVGVAGDIDSERGVVRVSPNLGWKNVPLRNLLKRHLAFPIMVDNDANAAAWGIFHTQVPASAQNVIVITLGTGVGGGIILNRSLHRGATGSAGEIGHMTLVQNGRRCNCGNRGCLEAYAGGYYLAKYARQMAKAGGTALEKWSELNGELTAKSLAQAANAGNRAAKNLWEEAGRMLGIAIGNLVYTLNPDTVVLTGGVAKAGGLLLRPARRVLRERTFKTITGAVRVKIAKGATEAGVIGASLL